MVKNNKSHLLTEILTARVSQDRKDELQHLSRLKELAGEKVSVSALVNEAIEQYIFTSLKAAPVPLENKELDDREIMFVRFDKKTDFNLEEIDKKCEAVKNYLSEDTSKTNEQIKSVVETFKYYANHKVNEKKKHEELYSELRRLEEELNTKIKLLNKYEYYENE